ncbi:MAG: hypothetical protein D3906_12955 [Candidatus Electrothrix sp. AUS1_2]|nr:hypothetical protein [Candidatus Electrothrix sp. AUS1_2]
MFLTGRLTSFFRAVFGKKNGALPKSGYTYTLPGRPLQRSRKRVCAALPLILPIIGLVWLIFFPPFSRQDLVKALRLPVGMFKAIDQEEPGDRSTIEQQDHPILRGTIYDRNMEEMSVSYRFFSLLVQPAELSDREKVAEQLALILEREKEDLLQQLQRADGIIELADNLEMRQIEAIERLHLQGIYLPCPELRPCPEPLKAEENPGSAGLNPAGADTPATVPRTDHSQEHSA